MGSWSSLNVGQMLRGASGSFGYGWGGWILPLIGLAAVVLSRDVRQRHVIKFLAVLVVTVALAVLVSHNWLSTFAPDVNVLLVLVGVATAVLAALAMSAVEVDRVAMRGAGHALKGVAVALLLVATLPLLAQSASGRFNLPVTGTPESLGSLGPSGVGGYRVLWLGQPDVLPVAGWSVAPGLAAATTTNGLPSGASLFAAPDPGAMSVVLHAVHQALLGQTVRLGQLVAPFGVATIVVMSAEAPSLDGVQSLPPVPPPANLIVALKRQSDLAITAHSPGVTVFSDALFHGIVAERPQPLAASTTSASNSGARGWRPVLDAATQAGTITAGTVLAGLTPATSFQLMVNGRAAPRHVSLGGAAVFTAPAGTATLQLQQFPWNGLLALATVALWLALALGFGGLQRIGRLRRRRRRPAHGARTAKNAVES